MKLAELPEANTRAVRLACEVMRRYASPAMANHAARSACWARAIGHAEHLDFDVELLQVAALLHDLGLEEPFDSHRCSFEQSGGEVSWVFAAGADWPEPRRDRLVEVIVRHMWTAVKVDYDVEGHLLERATAFDIAAAGWDLIDPALRAEVLAAWPPLDITERFLSCFNDQAERKPNSAAARSMASGLPARMASHPMLRPSLG